jgi:hypothetical protein
VFLIAHLHSPCRAHESTILASAADEFSRLPVKTPETLLMQRNDVRDGDLYHLDNAATADALNGAANDEPYHGLCRATQRRADLREFIVSAT